MPLKISRREMLLAASASSIILPNQAHALWPVIGFFARVGISAAARRSAGSVISRSVASAVARPVATSALRRTTRSRRDDAEAQMRSSGFSRVLDEVGGELVSDIAANVMFPDSPSLSPQTVLIHAENSVSDGEHGFAQCLAIVTPQSGPSGTVMIESPEILSFDRLQETAAFHYGLRDRELARMSYPVSIIDKGDYSYEYGHLTPTRLRTAEGVVHLDSSVSGDRGFISARFIPSARSRFPTLEIETEVT